MRVDNMRLTVDAHAGKTGKVFGHHNNSCNVRHHVDLPAGQPAMTWMIIVGEIKTKNKYFVYIVPVNILRAQLYPLQL